MYRDGYTADPNLVLYAKDTLEEAGFQVAGAVTTTHFSDRAKYNETVSAAGCYSDKRANEKMAEVFSATAEMFNEIIIDDWFFTVCHCYECTKSRHNATWQAHRVEIMANVAKKFIVEPAKAANPNVKLVIKFPQWFENWADGGYDMKKLVPLFDEIAVGVETRNPLLGRYMPTAGGMLFRYMKEAAGVKVKRAWYDAYMSDAKIFSEQAYQAVLSGATEVILFCAGYLPLEKVRNLTEQLIKDTESIDKAALSAKLLVVPVIRKVGARGENKLPQYLLMAGVPVYLTDKRSLTSKIVIMTEQSAMKKEYNLLMKEMLDLKKEIVITPGFAVNAGKYLEVEKLAQPVMIKEIKMKSKVFKIKEKLFMEYTLIPAKNVQVVVWAEGIPLLSRMVVEKRTVWFLNLPMSKETLKDQMGMQIQSDYRNLLRLPEPVLEAVRAVFKPYAEVGKYAKIKMLHKHII